jgi:hypothetical protein
MEVSLLLEPKNMALVGIDLNNRTGGVYFRLGLEAGYTGQYDGSIQQEFLSAISSIKERGIEVSRWTGDERFAQL